MSLEPIQNHTVNHPTSANGHVQRRANDWEKWPDCIEALRVSPGQVWQVGTVTLHGRLALAMIGPARSIRRARLCRSDGESRALVFLTFPSIEAILVPVPPNLNRNNQEEAGRQQLRQRLPQTTRHQHVEPCAAAAGSGVLPAQRVIIVDGSNSTATLVYAAWRDRAICVSAIVAFLLAAILYAGFGRDVTRPGTSDAPRDWSS